MKRFPQKNKAFTMVELMVTLLIVFIISAVAIPVYNSYVRKSKIAEGYSGLNNLLKLETTYYLEKKEFIMVPQNPATMPSPTHQSFENQTEWGRLGTLFPFGTKVQFSYGAFAGKTDASGSEINLNVTGTHDSVSTTWTGGTSGSVECTPPVTLGTYVDITGKSQYAWAFIYAIANLVEDSSPLSSKCTRLMKLIDIGDRGDLNVGNAMITQNLTE